MHLIEQCLEGRYIQTFKTHRKNSPLINIFGISKRLYHLEQTYITFINVYKLLLLQGKRTGITCTFITYMMTATNRNRCKGENHKKSKDPKASHASRFWTTVHMSPASGYL